MQDKTETLDYALTDLEPPYELEEERKIGRLLDKYDIPFFYKQPTVVLNKDNGENEIWKPSFTLPQYGCSVIDYIAKPTGNTLQKRIEAYRYNQIPATVLGPRSLDKFNWQESLYKRLQKEFQRMQKLSVYEGL